MIDRIFPLLRISIGIVYCWFGALKFFPHMSPADQLAKDTIRALTLGVIPDGVSILLLAIWETGLGLLLIAGRWNRWVFYLLITHLMLTFTPLFLFSDQSFTTPPYCFTLVGQYIMKNIIIMAAAFALDQYYRPTAVSVEKG